jgi:hypothetical protein
MTPETLNKYHSKWPETKIAFNLHLFLTKCIRIISCVWFLYIKNVVLGNFSIKSTGRASTCLWICFCGFRPAGGLFESQATNSSEPERGRSRRESSLLPIGYLEVIYDFQLQGYGIFIAIRIRVK